MIRRTDGSAHNAAAETAAPIAKTHDRTMPLYASSSHGPDGRTVSAVQQKNAATRVRRARGTASTMRRQPRSSSG
ncbi:hypothetical protein AVL59_13835 [Streptomyces griseochromogenes]|uniref:Uncharacterized protein n=1 Tax=Streptomyces griseochromogenes TaxID=68214 RepID=A0A1B1AVE8_9ACTN|nr:hypothetical protein AVL59_13835 [Streptomyces griseochromogenes]